MEKMKLINKIIVKTAHDLFDDFLFNSELSEP